MPYRSVVHHQWYAWGGKGEFLCTCKKTYICNLYLLYPVGMQDTRYQCILEMVEREAHLTSPHFTSPHLTLTSPHPTSPHPTSPHLTLTSPHFTSPHLTLTSPHLTLTSPSPYLTSPHLTLTSPHPSPLHVRSGQHREHLLHECSLTAALQYRCAYRIYTW